MSFVYSAFVPHLFIGLIITVSYSYLNLKYHFFLIISSEIRIAKHLFVEQFTIFRA